MHNKTIFRSLFNSGSTFPCESQIKNAKPHWFHILPYYFIRILLAFDFRFVLDLPLNSLYQCMMHVPPISNPKECDEDEKKRGKNEHHTQHLLECLAHIFTDKYPKYIVFSMTVDCYCMTVDCYWYICLLFVHSKTEYWISLVCNFDLTLSTPNSIGIFFGSWCFPI